VEAAVTDQRRVTRSAARSRKQILDLPLQYVIGWQPDRVAHPTAFQRVVDPGPGERSVRPDHDPVSASAVPINDGQQDLVHPSALWTLLGRSFAARQAPSGLNTKSG
jgi:hypothetical protein